MSADLRRMLALPVRAQAVLRVSFVQISKDPTASRGVSCTPEGCLAFERSVTAFTAKVAGPFHRREAEVRKGGRTSKSDGGAKRRGAIMTVLASLRTRFPKVTLDHFLSEIERWLAEGRSIFESELAELQRANAPPPLAPAFHPGQ